MYNMVYDISVGDFKVNQLLSCEVRKSANKLSDTATLKLVGMAYSKALEVESKIKRGDQVNIKLGYNDNPIQEFKGYISSIITDNTIVIECEDGMFVFRKEVANKQYKNTKVEDIIKDVVNQIGGFTVVVGDGVGDVIYDKFTISNATAYDVFKKIKEDTSLHIFVKQEELHIHLKYTYKEGGVKYDPTRNYESTSLKYIREEDKKVEVEVVGINRKHEKTKVIVGEKGGDKFTVHRYNINDKSALEKIGGEELKKYKYTGYEGSLTTWLLPYSTYGYSAELKEIDYPEREGIYYVEAVTTVFNSSGGKRKVTLGIKLA